MLHCEKAARRHDGRRLKATASLPPGGSRFRPFPSGRDLLQVESAALAGPPAGPAFSVCGRGLKLRGSGRTAAASIRRGVVIEPAGAASRPRALPPRRGHRPRPGRAPPGLEQKSSSPRDFHVLHDLHRVDAHASHAFEKIDHVLLVVGEAVGVKLLADGRILRRLLLVLVENPFERGAVAGGTSRPRTARP